MSLHVPPRPEVARRLHAQRRNSTVASIVIALLGITLIGLVLALVLLPSLFQETPVIVGYQEPTAAEESIEPSKVNPLRSKPSAPSAAAAPRVIASYAPAAVTVEIPEITMESETFGQGLDDFSDGGLGAGAGGNGGGPGGGFGTTGPRPGSLEGRLYDFKQRPDGTAVPYHLSDRAEFTERVARLQRSRFSKPALRRHFQAPNRLFLSHLAIPLSDASSGPEYFGAKDTIKPSGWMAHYHGKIVVPKTGSYRFVGLGDDYIGVFLDGRMRLAACWSDIQEMIAGRWEPSEPTGKFTSPFSGMRLVFGDWVKLEAGEVIDFDLAIGERPGGKVGFVLMIEEKGVAYRKASDGRPILPLFATAPVSDEEMRRITRDFGAWEFEWEKMPLFGVK